MSNDSFNGWTLHELAALEAAERGLAKAKHGKRFDADVFHAVAKTEADKLREDAFQSLSSATGDPT